MADAPAAPAPSAAPAVKSGWKTTEAWLLMLLLGTLAYLAQQLVTLLPSIAAQPGMPSWVAMVLPVATLGIAWVGKSAIAKYTDARQALKLGSTVQVTPDQAAQLIAALPAAKP